MQLFVNDQIKISIIHTPGPDGANLLVRPLGGEEGRVVPMARAQIAGGGGKERTLGAIHRLFGSLRMLACAVMRKESHFLAN